MNRLLDPVAVPTTPQVKSSPNGAERELRPPAARPESSTDNAREAAPIPNGVNGEAQAPTSPQPSTSGREANGRFAKGNPGGTGNPFARQSAALRREVQDKLTNGSLGNIVERLIQQAENGDVAAAKLVLAYGIGKPTDAADPDTLDQHEWQVLKQQVMPSEIGTLLDAFPIKTMCRVAKQAVVPMLHERFVRTMHQGFVDRGWPEAALFNRPAPADQAPIGNGSNGADVKTPRDRAAKRKKLKKKYAIKRGKLVERTE